MNAMGVFSADKKDTGACRMMTRLSYLELRVSALLRLRVTPTLEEGVLGVTSKVNPQSHLKSRLQTPTNISAMQEDFLDWTQPRSLAVTPRSLAATPL